MKRVCHFQIFLASVSFFFVFMQKTNNPHIFHFDKGQRKIDYLHISVNIKNLIERKDLDHGFERIYRVLGILLLKLSTCIVLFLCSLVLE